MSIPTLSSYLLPSSTPTIHPLSTRFLLYLLYFPTLFSLIPYFSSPLMLIISPFLSPTNLIISAISILLLHLLPLLHFFPYYPSSLNLHYQPYPFFSFSPLSSCLLRFNPFQHPYILTSFTHSPLIFPLPLLSLIIPATRLQSFYHPSLVTPLPFTPLIISPLPVFVSSISQPSFHLSPIYLLTQSLTYPHSSPPPTSSILPLLYPALFFLSLLYLDGRIDLICYLLNFTEKIYVSYNGGNKLSGVNYILESSSLRSRIIRHNSLVFGV